MKSSPKEIAARWKEQMKKGYLKDDNIICADA